MLGVWVSSMAIMTVAAADFSTHASLTRTQNLELATQAARAHLDDRRQAGYEALPDPSTGATSVTQAFTPSGSLPSATGQVVVTYLDDALTPATVDTGRRRVVATVSWAGAARDTGSVTLTTLIKK